MAEFDIYKDIAERTKGDIYIGVVGPVRTGKSTFIKRFMDLLVIPNIENAYTRERAKDELPQSATGKVVMTTEPKFVPNEAVPVSFGDISAKVRMIDCVGYMVPGAEGEYDGETLRMINTPWSGDAMPFNEAAEMGTKKVITDHSTIGVVVTTDGSISDIERKNYEEAEARVVSELKEMGKPFVLLLNSARPYSSETENLREELSERYSVPVMTVNALQLKTDDISSIMEKILYEFPVKEVDFIMPRWINTLDSDHWLKKEIIKSVKSKMGDVNKLREVFMYTDALEENEFVKKAYISGIRLGEGVAEVDAALEDGLFYKVLSETLEMPIADDFQLVSTIKQLSGIKKNYDKVELALGDVRRKGYGVVTPVLSEIKIDEPELFKQGNRYGIKIRASGESLHLIKADIKTEVSPIVGTEEQSREFIDNIIKDYKEDPEKILELNIFGRSLSNLVTEGINSKIYQMPEDAQAKMGTALQKIINEGHGGVICILL